MKSSAICLAVDEAKKSLHSSFKHGAVLYNGKNIISQGHNKDVNKHYIFRSLHAEMAAVRNAKQLKLKKNDKNHLIMFVVRINKSGNLCHSKPCSHCQQIMKSYGIQKVCFSVNEGGIDYMYL